MSGRMMSIAAASVPRPRNSAIANSAMFTVSTAVVTLRLSSAPRSPPNSWRTAVWRAPQ